MKFLTMQGRQMPALGYGTWRLDGDACARAVRMALDIGYRHFDTAQIYENEADVGRALAESKMERRQLFVTTKLWTSNYTAERVAASTNESLKKLRMEYVDLLLMHWPNPDIPIKETLAAMQEVMRKGRAKAIGVSNFPVRWMKEAVEIGGAPIACNQVEYHPLLSQHAVLDYARRHNIAVTAYSPVARGRLENHPLLVEIGGKHRKTASQVVLRWIVEQGVAAIPKAASEKNARLNFDIFDFSLSEAECKAIAALSDNTRLVNPEWAPQWDAA